MKVEVTVLGSPSLIVLTVSVDVFKRHVYIPKKTVWLLWNIDLEPALHSGGRLHQVKIMS